MKKKFTIRCENMKERFDWTTKIEENIEALNPSRANGVDLTPEEELRRERNARRQLQERNEELNRRVVELQRRLDEEVKLRKSLEDKLKRRANRTGSGSPPSSPVVERERT